MNAGVSVDEDALGGEALGAVAGNGVAVVKMPVLCRIETDLASRFQAGRNAAIGCNRTDHGKVAVGDAKCFVGRGELDAIASGKLAVDLPVDADAGEAAGIVAGNFSIRFYDGKLIGYRVHSQGKRILNAICSGG